MRCPQCHGATRVTDTMKIETKVIRRRKCLSCGQRFTTEELVILKPVI